MVDTVCEPLMQSAWAQNSILKILFGSGKGSGAALMLFMLGAAGVLLCVLFGRRLSQYTYTD